MKTAATSPLEPWNSRYSMVDAWRGLAAFGVVCHHLGIGTSFNLGHLCVMVFFVISGYCIASTTESCIRNGVGFGGFMLRRVRRIYPPYLFAVLFFFVTRVLKLAVGAGNQISSSVIEWIQNLTLTQWTHLLIEPKSLPAENTHLFVSAFWSLNYEEQFYLLMAVFGALALAFRVPVRRSVAILVLPCFLWNIVHPSVCNGLFVEYWVHFAVGVLVYYRLCSPLTRTMARVIDLGLILFAALAVICLPKGPVLVRSVYIEWTVVSFFALGMIFLRRWDTVFHKTSIGRALCTFGAITYSLYLTHQFNLRPTRFVADRMVGFGAPHFLALPLQIAVLLAIATVFWYFCERPFLNRPVTRRAQVAAAVAEPNTA